MLVNINEYSLDEIFFFFQKYTKKYEIIYKNKSRSDSLIPCIILDLVQHQLIQQQLRVQQRVHVQFSPVIGIISSYNNNLNNISY